MSLLHCLLTAQPSNLNTFLWRLLNYSLFPWSVTAVSILTQAMLIFFLLLWLSQSLLSSSLICAGINLQDDPRVKEKIKDEEVHYMGLHEKALKQILSQQRAQMRNLSKGNNYLSYLRLIWSYQIKTNSTESVREMQSFKWDINANVWSYVEKTRCQERAFSKNQTPSWLIIFVCNWCQCPYGHVPILQQG